MMKLNMKHKFIFIFLLSGILTAGAQEYTSFDMRWLTNDVKANGVTDFHGETEWLDTVGRVDALNKYADFAASFWGDPKLNTPLFDDNQVRERTKAIKPQPLTAVRRTVRLDEWKSCGYKKGLETIKAEALSQWTCKSATLADGCLVIKAGKVSHQIDTIDWRFSMKMALKSYSSGLSISLSDSAGAELQFDLGAIGDGVAGGNFEIYGDLPNRCFFISSAGKTLKEVQMPSSFGNKITGFSIDSSDGETCIDAFSLYSFVLRDGDKHIPFETRLIFDEDFNGVPNMSGWNLDSYDDTRWQTVSLPAPHGGLKAEGESLYLRTKVETGAFKHASLEIESLDPAGEVWVNGEIAAVVRGRIPRSIDITEYLLPNSVNTIAVRVKPYVSQHPMHHAPSDHNIGWFLGRTSLILTDDTSYITENMVHTSSLNDSSAVQRHKIKIRNKTGFSRKAKLQINYYPWFPAEGECVASISKDIEIRPRIENVYDVDMSLNAPQVWTTSSPKLYRVEVVLSDENGNLMDGHVTTTGVRVIEQEEGVLYINHKPDMLNGAKNFGYRLPIEDISKTIRCATDEMVMRDLMMAEKLGGNLLRVHVHAEKDIVDGINDPRYAEYADQMGIYLIWQSAGWLREGEAWNVDIENWPSYIRQVYNHPSIVLWEASNHPNRFKDHKVNDTEDYFNAIITRIAAADTSRLISPTSFWPHSHYANYDGTLTYQGDTIAPNPILMHKMMTRGSQDAYTGYGEKWSTLRKFPYDWAKVCLEAKDLCYFNFEHEESAAQPNWNLTRKDPWHEVQSYEWEYEKGSIGRLLEMDEWRASQAFQAFSAWESMKIQTLAGVCGFSWCSLESGANMFTYQKPLVDPYYVPKLAFHANKMVFKRIWAASDDVDTVYGPDDMIHPVIFNLGDACVADLTVELRNSKGKVVERKVFRSVEVAQGRSVTRLEAFRFGKKHEGCHFIVYKLVCKN